MGVSAVTCGGVIMGAGKRYMACNGVCDGGGGGGGGGGVTAVHDDFQDP